MKSFFAFVCAVAVAGSASVASAASKSETVVLSAPVAVGSTILATGDCKVSYSGDGPDVQVTFAERGVAPVTVPATLVKEKHNHAGVTLVGAGSTKGLMSAELGSVKLVMKDQPASGQ